MGSYLKGGFREGIGSFAVLTLPFIVIGLIVLYAISIGAYGPVLYAGPLLWEPYLFSPVPGCACDSVNMLTYFSDGNLFGFWWYMAIYYVSLIGIAGYFIGKWMITKIH